MLLLHHDSSTLTFKIERNCLTINNQIRQGFIDLVISDGRPNSFFSFISQAHGVFYAMHPGVKFLERDDTQTLRQDIHITVRYTIPYHIMPGTTPDHIIPHYAKPHYTTSHHITQQHITQQHITHTTPHQTISHRIPSHHTTHYITPNQTISHHHHITSHHITQQHITHTPNHITSHRFTSHQ